MGNGKDPLGILTTTPAPQKKVADPLGILKKKDWVSRTFGTGSQNGGLSGGSGLGKIGMAVEKAPKTPQEKVNSLGINVTFEKEQPKNLLENPGIYYKQPDFLQASKPTYIDVDNPEHLSYLSSKVKEAKDKADPTKYGLFISDEQKEKYRPGEAKEKIAYADELMQEISGAAAKNAFNKIISEKHPSMIGRNDLTQVGIEYLKQVDPAQYKRNKTIIDAGEDLGDENKYNLEKIGGSILKNNLPFITDDAATLNNIEELTQLTDQAHPEIALAKGWDIIGAYNHKKDNKATGGWWRTKPTLGQAKKWIDEPELVEMFKGNEVAYDEIKRKLSEMPDELNNFKLDEVPVGGLMNNFGRAILGSAENVGNIFRGDVKRQQANLNPTLGRGTLTGNYHDPGESPALLQQLYSLEANEKDGTITESEKQQLKALRNSTKVRDGWDKIADGTGNISGQVVSQVLLSKGAGLGTNSVSKLASLSNATKNTINASIATALNSYDQSRQQAVYNFPDDKVKQGIYTGTMVAANVASERIFKDEKVLDAFKKELKGDLVNYVKNLSTQNINRAAIKNLLTEKLLKFGGETIKESNKEAIEESVVQVVDEAMQAGLGAEGYDGDKALERIGNTYATTMLYGGAVGALAAKSNLAADKFNRVQIYRMANNPEVFQKEIQRQFEAGDITNAERQEKFDILNKAAEIAAAEPPKVAALPTKKKAEYLTHQLNIAINEGLLEGAKDPNLQEELKGNIEESQKRAKAIYESEPEVLEEISEPELTPEQTKAAKILGLANLPDTLMVGAEADPVGTLKDIAHQAQGVGVNPETGQIEPLDGGGRTEDLLAMGYPQKVIDQAIEMFPAQPKLADQVRELADENTPDEAGVSGSALKDVEVDIDKLFPRNRQSSPDFRSHQGDRYEISMKPVDINDRSKGYVVNVARSLKDGRYLHSEELSSEFKTRQEAEEYALQFIQKDQQTAPTQYTEAATPAKKQSEGVSGSALKDVGNEQNDRVVEINPSEISLKDKFSKDEFNNARNRIRSGGKSRTPNEPISVTKNIETGEIKVTNGYHRLFNEDGTLKDKVDATVTLVKTVDRGRHSEDVPMPTQYTEAATHRQNIHDKFRKEFEAKGVPKEQVDGAIALMEARAKSWASEEKGRNPDDWYSRIADVKSGEFVDGSGKQFQVEAYHGSPHDFDKFSTSKIGTGEGAAAFGHGLYFTDLKGIAEEYARRLSNDSPTIDGKKIDDWFRDNDLKAPYSSNYWMPELLSESKSKEEALSKIDLRIKSQEGKIDGYNDILDDGESTQNERAGARRALEVLEKDLQVSYDLYNAVFRSKSFEPPTKGRNLYKVSLHEGKQPSEYNWLDWDKDLPKEKIDKIRKALLEYDLPDGYSWATDSNKNKNHVVHQVKDAKGNIVGEGIDKEEASKDAGIGKRFYPYFGEERRLAEFDKVFKRGSDGKYTTGAGFYHRLSELLGSDKAASDLLLKAGIDGVKYPAESIARGATSDNARGFNYVVFDDKAVTIKEKIQFQNQKGAVETLADGRKVIHALDAPDFSTMVHEIAHVFEGDLTEAESKIVKDFGGSEPFARGFERYLRDGKAPTTELKTLFEKFKQWLTNIYKTLKGSPIEKRISLEIKQIFDRLLTEQKEAPTQYTEAATPAKKQSEGVSGSALKDVESFETSQGSVYKVGEDGKTSRFKTKTGEQKEPQDLTVFAKFEGQQADDYLQALHGYNGETVHVVGVIDGKVQEIKTNEDAAKATHIKLTIVDKDGKITDKIEASNIPVKGYNVFDQRKISENKYEKHIGNEVSKINYKPKATTQYTEAAGVSGSALKDVHSNNSELSKIGTEQEYAEYLKTIFPDSKVKDIMYHRSNAEFDKFDNSKLNKETGGLFDFTKESGIERYGKNEYPVLLNIKKIGKGFELKDGQDGVQSTEMLPNGKEVYSVPDANQIHILGSKSDIEGFKKWKEGKATTQYTEAATPKEQAQKIADLTEKRDRDIAVASKPDVKLEFVSAKELVDSKDPIGNRNIHNDIKERFKKLKEILDCIHG